MSRENDEMEQKTEELVGKLDSLKKKAKEMEDERDACKALAGDLDGGVLLMGRKLAELEDTTNTLKQRKAAAREKSVELKDAIQELKKELNKPAEDKGVDPLVAARKAVARDLKATKAKLAKEEEKAAKIAKATEVTQKKVTNTRSAIETKRGEVEASQGEMATETAKQEKAMAAHANEKDGKAAELTREIEEKKGQCAAKEAEAKEKDAELARLKEETKDNVTEAQAAIKEMKAELAALKVKCVEEKKKTKSAAKKAQELAAQVAGMATAKDRRIKMLKSLKEVCKDTRTSLEPMKKSVMNFDKLVPDFLPKLMKKVGQWQAKQGKTDQTLVENYEKETKLRRKYFNELQELKGAIRLFCRVRGLVDGESNRVISIPTEDQINVKHEDKPMIYDFDDHVIKPTHTNADVAKTLSDHMTSSMDGHVSNVFAFGQTGSGKTSTMCGREGDKGLFFLAVDALWANAAKRGPDCKFEFEVSVVEVDEGGNVSDLSSGDRSSLSLEEGDEGMVITDRTWHAVKSADEALAIVAQGVQATKGAIDPDATTTILSFRVKGYNSTLERDMDGQLNLVELPGSEQKDMLKGVVAVLHQLSQKKSPKYNESPLSHILQPFLVNKAKVVVLLHVCPCDADESIVSLNWATSMKKQEEAPPKKRKSSKAHGSKTPKKTPRKTSRR